MSNQRTATSILTTAPSLTLALRFLLEAGIVAAFSWWGYHLGGPSQTSRITFALIIPAAVFGVWGTIDFRSTGRYAEPLRLIEELVISALAVLALNDTHQVGFAGVLALLTVIYYGLVYATGNRLINDGDCLPSDGGKR